ncbi:MAG: glycosyltransferase family 4 protein [Prevotellaceae bacterium]|jgi:glycosyltransferase involved in cell wall biosynthesis|nr:glycosyltransferase family 4 protein [Prevotellaceae bacterium]
MKTLIVCSKNSGKIAPFILDQAESLKAQGIEIEFFTVSSKGLRGYLKSRKGLLQIINDFQPNIIHAHYGLSGLLANLQRKIPVITTYHGSDINNKKVLKFSKIAIFLSKFNIFVSQKNIEIAKPKKNYDLIPCGIDFDIFKPLDKEKCRAKFGFTNDEKLVLFSSSFDNQVKNSELAHSAVNLLPNVKLIELKGYTREQVCELMNAADAVLMTSRTEGSPQFIKEAMACNCPIISVNVGDVESVIADTENCFVCAYNAEEIAENLQKIIIANTRTTGRNKVLNFDNKKVAKKIIDIYKKIISR